MTLKLAERVATAAPAPSLSRAGIREVRGLRGLLEEVVGRPPSGEAAAIPIRFSPPSWDEMRYARALSLKLGAPTARAVGVVYRARAANASLVLRGHGVRVDLGPAGAAERLRFETPGAARRFAILHALLDRGPCFLEVRGEQVVVFRGSRLRTRTLLRAQEALWGVLRAPRTPVATLLCARLGSGTLIAEGAFDRRTQGLLRELLDQGQEEVESVGAEASLAPRGAMQMRRGRLRAWLEPRPERRKASAALSVALGQGARRSACGLLGDALPLTELALHDRPGGQRLGALPPSARESYPVVDRRGSWLLLSTPAGRALGWVLYSADQLRFLRP